MFNFSKLNKIAIMSLFLLGSLIMGGCAHTVELEKMKEIEQDWKPLTIQFLAIKATPSEKTIDVECSFKLNNPNDREVLLGMVSFMPMASTVWNLRYWTWRNVYEHTFIPAHASITLNEGYTIRKAGLENVWPALTSPDARWGYSVIASISPVELDVRAEMPFAR